MNENNEMEPNVVPTGVPEQAQPETPVVEAPVVEAPVVETPVVETPVVETPVAEAPVVEAPVVEAPVEEPVVETAPVVESPVVEAAPAEEASFATEPAPSVDVAPAIEPAVEPAPVEGTSTLDAAPAIETPSGEPSGLGEQPAESPVEEPKKKNNMVMIIIIVVLAVGIGVVLFLILGKKDEEKPTPVENNTKEEATAEQTEFLALAQKYVDAVDALWTSDSMLCQDTADQTKEKKPSELTQTDSYGGPAYYYVFIDTGSADEMKLDVETTKKLGGWIRIGAPDKSYYVALSDGTNYIVDPGYENNKNFKDIKAIDVVTTGNGNNYQYLNGTVWGAANQGNGWRMGDAVVLTDTDESNDGDYMTNGPKTSGWTPFCKNVK